MDIIDALLRQGPLIAIGTGIYMLGLVLGLAFTITYGVTAPWWRSAIGRMFIVIGTAIVMAGATVILSILLGADYLGREFVRLAGFGIFSTAMGFLFFTYLHERRKPTSELPIRKGPFMADHKVAEVTPIWFPWQRVKRVLVVLLFTVVPTLNVAIPQIVTAFDGYVDAGTFAIINAIAAGILLVAGIITRILAVPAVNEFLVWLGIGSVPKSALPPKA